MVWYGDEVQQHHLIPEELQLNTDENVTVNVSASTHRKLHRIIKNHVSLTNLWELRNQTQSHLDKINETIRRQVLLVQLEWLLTNSFEDLIDFFDTLNQMDTKNGGKNPNYDKWNSQTMGYFKDIMEYLERKIQKRKIQMERGVNK